MRTRDEVLHAFTPVKKLSPGQVARLEQLELRAKEFATDILDLIPDTPDRVRALDMLLQVKQRCTQTLTHSAPPEEALNAKKD